ncbi:hypothetical protein ACFP56_08135 [Paenibacillus septentrionalis]|uniref:Uncharacterized protein n=1 Tax=Paenibacillus septentrionalis TaxID=429342 RepID=A0ABW1V2A0_9BACL
MNMEQQTATKAIATPQEERLQSTEHVTSDNQNELPPITGSRQWKSLYQAISSYAKDIKAHSKR